MNWKNEQAKQELIQKAVNYIANAKNSYEKARAQEIKHILGFPDNDSGKFGKLYELLENSSKSHKTSFSGNGEKDGTIKIRFTDKDAIYYLNCERKTNGGRIDETTLKAKYIIYKLDICNSTTQNKRVCYPAKLIPLKQFVDFLYSVNAVRIVKRDNGTGIQCSNRKLWAALENWSINYDSEKTYTDTDFNGLVFGH